MPKPQAELKALHNWPTKDVIEASNAIKLRLCRERRNLDKLTLTPEGWQADMKLQFEGAIPEDEDTEKPNQVSPTLSAFLDAIYWSFAHSLTPLCPLFFYSEVFLSEVKKEGTNKIECWAATFGDIFKNPYTDG